ncbi:uncharacterized protein YlxW (UPF0749 family) [Scopulibacillus darangshiensis]|uniref:Uncharacterized protein YlxW (UPF0749 family) n=1 Tax=Scopulibacillus darangshiensis TaxID=442528 RepID=A0A4R2P4T9_9BACL|nr:DUF881 domain-containing protein [Scopulibacillus darangshiensis]TCP29094.1 uncharacterized protein YlxW (UPF0749 family) [Scopulibacillus darangshiensis]
MKKNSVLFSVVLLVTGFILAYSFQYVNEKRDSSAHKSDEQWKREHQLRNKLIHEQEANRDLENKLVKMRDKVQTHEKKVAAQKKNAVHLVEQLNKYRMIVGTRKVAGEGISVTLSDGNYVTNGDNPNNYIVHQQDIQEVIYELLAAGAEAVAINGKRITTHSYIECVGPVVKVDGKRFTAPFIVSAIGDPKLLDGGLKMNGNTVDQLEARGIDVMVKREKTIVLDPLI